MSETTSPRTGLTRRSFLKATGATAGAMLLVGQGAAFTALADDGGNGVAGASEELFSCACRSNCMGGCQYWAHVSDGKLLKLTPVSYPVEGYRGACLKGVSYVERIYSPTRVQHPLRRAGERGEGQWERVSWDEAIQEVAEKIGSVVEEYGPKAVAFDCGSGNFGFFNGAYTLFNRLSAVMGATKPSSCWDYATGYGIGRVLGTTEFDFGHEINSIVDASMIVIWGSNPVCSAPQNWRWIQWAHEKGARLVSIDPVKSITAHRCDDWISIMPGQDGYLALAMANYLIENDLANWDFIKSRSTAAFLVRRDTKKHLRKSDYQEVPIDPVMQTPIDDFYVWDNATQAPALVSEASDPALEGTFTTSDGVEVDTAFSLLKKELAQYSTKKASELTGILEEKIIELARSFASERAVAVSITYGTDHYVNGYQTSWAIATLMAIAGQLGRSGAGFYGTFSGPYFPNVVGLWAGTPEFKGLNSEIPHCMIPEVLAQQKLEGNDYPLKAMITWCSNPVSNMPSQKDWLEKALPNLDYWVVIDSELGDSARHADMVLPCASWYEKEDFRVAVNNPYITISEKAIEPLHDSKSDWEIACLLGRALGYEASFPESMTEEDWLKVLFDDDLSKAMGLTWDRLKEEKIIQLTPVEPGTPWIKGESSPFPSESGRVQLYCENPLPRLDYGQDLSEREPHEHVVYYQPPLECGADNPLAQKYPLVFVQDHARFRVHAQWWETPVLRELDPEPLARVNSIEAEQRGIADSDIVEVFNDRGHAVLKCRIDNAVSPGVLSVPKGWQRHQFVAGGFQEMTQPKMDPYPSAAAFFDSRVDFRKWEG